jgi:hypothetical protein
MRPVFLIALIVVANTVAVAQSTKLPEILTPDTYLRSQAENEGISVFKLVPRGMFKDPDGSYSDRDNPIGIRGGGAFYSFSTGSHSYNKIPQIMLESDNFGTGFSGLNYGFLIDLGIAPVTAVTADMAELEFLTSYKPPTIIADIRNEQYKSRIETKGFAYCRRLPVIIGHTYVLRAIGYDEADVLVALNVVGKGDDGSLTIAWKKLAEFSKPTYERTASVTDSSSFLKP